MAKSPKKSEDELLPLNPKQEAFCQEYLKDLHLSAAYTRAYPDATGDSARANASRLIANVNIQSRIAELMKERAARMHLTNDMVVKRLCDVAFGNIGMICVWTNNGLDLKDKDLLTESELAIIASLDISPVGDGDGGLLGYRKKVHLRDSLKALELLGKHLGMLDGIGGKGKNTESYAGKLLELVDRVTKRPAGNAK